MGHLTCNKPKPFDFGADLYHDFRIVLQLRDRSNYKNIAGTAALADNCGL